MCVLLPGFCRCALCLQGSVWGSGSAGTLCAICALATGNAAFWQVIYALSSTAASLPKAIMHQLKLEIAILSHTVQKGTSCELYKCLTFSHLVCTILLRLSLVSAACCQATAQQQKPIWPVHI